MIRAPSKHIDYTNKDYESFRNMMIQGLREFMPEYTDTSQTDAGIVIIEQLARAMDILSFHQDTYANEAFFITSRDRETATRWAKGLGYIPKNKTAAIHEQVFILNNIYEHDFIIGKGVQVKTQQTMLESSVIFETTRDLIIPAGSKGNEQDEHGKYLYTVHVRQGVTVKDEIVGSSNGLPNQRFQLNQRNIIVDSLNIYVNEGNGFILWQQVRTFIDSARNDRHYMTEVDEFDNTTIVFGDGFSGKIPNSAISNIIATYAIGGGVIGNVVRNTINVMETNIANIEYTFNPYSDFIPGVEKETLEEIKRNAPAHLRTLWRAVTLQDHKDLVLNHFPQVKFANAIQCPFDRNNTLLYILLCEGYEFLPNGAFHRELMQFFDQRKMIGNGVFILSPIFNEIELTADLHIKSDFLIKDVKTQVEEFVYEFFKIGNYDFETEFIYSDFEAMINSTISGVRSFRITVTDPIDKITPKPEEVIILKSLNIRVFGGIT